MPALSFFSLLFLKIFFFEMGMAKNSTSIIPVKVGVVLDFDNDLDGKIGLSCINMSLSDFYDTHGDYKTRLVLVTRDSKNDMLLVQLLQVPSLSLLFLDSVVSLLWL